MSAPDLDAALRSLCGDDVALDRRPLELEGTLRCRPIADTLASIGSRFADLGITRLIDLTPLDRVGVPVFNVCVPNPRTECYAAGKGLTRDACLVSALMEAFELRAALARQPRHEVLGRRHVDMAALGEAIAPADLPLPVRGDFTGDERHDWLRCLELGTGRPVHLPADLFGFAYGRGPGITRAVPRGNTNGLASGNSAYEAILHGLYELIERDALVLSNFGQPRRLLVPRAGLGPRLDELLDRIDGAGLELRLFDLTSDLDVPTYQAYLVDPCGFATYHLHTGHGCHHDGRVALARAITEACQVRLTTFAGAREDVADPVVDEAAYRALVSCHEAATPTALPPTGPPLDLDLAVADLLERLAAVGCPDVYVASLGLPGFEQVAMRCYAPGLEAPNRDDAGQLAVGARGWSYREQHGARHFGF